MFSEDAFKEIEKKIIEKDTPKPKFIAFDGSVHESEESLREADLIYFSKKGLKEIPIPEKLGKFNEIYFDGFLSGAIPKINPIDNKVSREISLDKMTYAEWNRMRVYFMNALNANEFASAPEFAIGIAEYLRDATVTITNPEDVFVMNEQLNELLGIICTLKEAQLKIEQR